MPSDLIGSKLQPNTKNNRVTVLCRGLCHIGALALPGQPMAIQVRISQGPIIIAQKHQQKNKTPTICNLN